MGRGGEAELRGLEAKLHGVPVGPLEARVAALEQSLYQLGRRASGACLITVDVVVTDSGTGLPVAGATVDLLSSGAVVVATGTTDALGDVTLTATFADAFSVEVTASGYVTGAAPASALCGQTVSAAVALAPGVTWAGCPAPVPRAGTLTDSAYGPCAVAWDGTAYFVGCRAVNYNGSGTGFANATGVAIAYRVDPSNGHLTVFYSSAPATVQPVAGSCPGGANRQWIASPGAPSSVACSPFAVQWGTGPTSSPPYNTTTGVIWTFP